MRLWLTFSVNKLRIRPAKPIILVVEQPEKARMSGRFCTTLYFEGEEAMDTILLVLLNFVLLAVYYTLFGVRRELIATKDLLKSELAEIHKLLAK
jgi:hypothetical protein